MSSPSITHRAWTGVWKLCKKRSVTVCVLLGALLCLPAIGPTLFTDDYVLGLSVRGEPRLSGLAQDRFDLFAFALGGVVPNHALIDQGLLLPWWSDPELKVVFFRPLSSLSHYLDFSLWADTPELMYVHSLLWLAAAIAAVASLYRSFAETQAEGVVAGLLFAVNDANGAAVNWISNRNVLIGVLFGTLGLAAHHRAREGSRLWSGPAVLWIGAALAAGEVGVWAFAYLLAYALVFDRDAFGRRALSLCPYALTLFLWQVVYAASGAGTRGSGVYLHPLWNFTGYLNALPTRALALLSSVWGVVPSEALFLGSSEDLPFILGTGLVICVTAIAVAYPHLRDDRTLRFWALGMLLSLVPVAASFPSDRLLLPANLGAMAIVARLVCVAVRPDGHRFIGRTRSIAGLFFVAAHGVLAPLSLPVRANGVQLLTRAMRRSVACLEEVQDIERRTVILVGGPTDLWISYLQAERSWKGLPRPKHLVWLTSPSSPLLVRSRPRALAFEQGAGVSFFQGPPERLYRSEGAPFSTGQRIELSTLDAVIDEVTPSGAPRRITFEFHEPIASDDYTLLVWQGDRYELTAPEQLSNGHRIPAAHFIDAVLSRRSPPLPGCGS